MLPFENGELVNLVRLSKQPLNIVADKNSGFLNVCLARLSPATNIMRIKRQDGCLLQNGKCSILRGRSPTIIVFQESGTVPTQQISS